MKETWKPVVGYEKLYEVSDHGRVKNGRARVLKNQVDEDGYHYTRLSDGSGQRKRFFLHQLVARTFVGECPAGHEVNHKDGKKANNRPSNLEYLTKLENNRHATRAGLRPRGDRHGKSKVRDADVPTIKALLKEGVPQRIIAARFGVTQPAISSIKCGHTRSRPA